MDINSRKHNKLKIVINILGLSLACPSHLPHQHFLCNTANDDEFVGELLGMVLALLMWSQHLYCQEDYIYEDIDQHLVILL